MEERTADNYPLASKKAQENLREANLQIAENNQVKFLGMHNRRLQYF